MSKLYIDNPPQEIIDFLNSRSNFTGIAKDSSKVSILSIIYDITSFLPQNCKFVQRKYHILNKTGNIPKCTVCNKNAVWSYKSINYSRWCSGICKNKDPFFKQKIKETFVEKYGTESFTSSELFKEKYKQHMQKTYGVDHYLQNVEKRDNTRNLVKSRYGFLSPLESDNIKEKIQKTYDLKYNGRHPTQQRFSDITINKLNKDWLYNEHVINRRTLSNISKECENYDISSLSDMFTKFNIPIIYYEIESSVELILKQLLIDNNISFLNNDRIIISPYELDIYIPSHKLAIEYCGLYWHNELKKDNNYHKMKYNMCKENGIRLITIFEDEWINNENLVKQKLKHILGISDQDKIFARKCKIVEIVNQDKKMFLNQNHIQGDGPSSINLGLYYNNELVACMGMLQDANKKHYNLSRYATSKNVVGGFSKLLTYFEKQYKPIQIYTFADLRWSQGDLYYKNHFLLDKILSPDYSYIVKNSRIHKFGFRHKQLAKKLKMYDPKLSEHENCLNNKIYRIYDCGKLRFIKNY